MYRLHSVSPLVHIEVADCLTNLTLLITVEASSRIPVRGETCVEQKHV